VKEIKDDARDALKAVDAGAKTAWELKMALKISHTRLHLALGALVERGAVALTEDSGTFKIERLQQETPIPFRTDRPRIAAP
jgi:hypothetical protein